jgi:RHH-type proline utilization regulon transcriptional repressor/proline dehydrogenase/delta 1-pyrroline-5-carboxylate dehydrogenase
MLGSDTKEIVTILRKLHQQGIAFTVDVLGEAVVSEAEADQYAQRYLDLFDVLGGEVAKWKQLCNSNDSPRGPLKGAIT